ncbi:hypothetical protein [Natronorarus salvus]|uniref:hypothetical protein n=1 Tax=Natronorarus salvus TaxID=3117733 RepID=UPI002F2682F3
MSDEYGFLTHTDRRFLIGKKEYTGENAKQQRYQRREAIAARARQAFHDFALLYDSVDEHERDRIFDVGDDVTDYDAINGFHDALVDTLAFIYLSLEGEVGSNTILHRGRSFSVPFDTILTQAVKKGEISRYDREMLGSMVSVEFDVDVREGADSLRTERAMDKIVRNRFNELTEEEMYSLLYSYAPGGALEVLGSGGYTRLDERVREKRDDLGIGPVEFSDEQLERIRQDNDAHE